MTKSKRVLALLLCMLMLSLMVIPASAAGVNTGFQRRELEYFDKVHSTDVNRYPRVSVTVSGKPLSEIAYNINSTTYIPLRALGNLIGAKVSFNDKSRTARVNASGLEIYASDGSYIIYANERALLSRSPAIILSDGRMYVPIRPIAKALSLDVQWQAPNTAKLSGTVKPLLHASKFYNSDDLYWLSRIISAESRGEPLAGQIAVGNVVLNRRAHRDYPNTIWGVIFDRKYGVQFSPIQDGSIHKEPSYLSVQAAKICLEGVSIDNKMLFFLEPTKANSAWIVINRKYAFTIGNHYFFY